MLAEKYDEKLKDMDDEDKAKVQNRWNLDNRDVNKAYAEYWYYVMMQDTDDDCIKDYYIEETNKLNNNLINTNAKNINNRVKNIDIIHLN